MKGILYSLGIGRDRTFVRSSICLVIVTYFYLFVVGFQAKIYSFLHRVTYENIFVTHIFSFNIDMSILLIAALAWAFFSIRDKYVKLITGTFFSALLVLLFSGYISMALTGAKLSLPVVVALIILDKSRNKRILKHGLERSWIYIGIVALGLAVSGILSLLLFVITGTITDTTEKYPYAILQELLASLTPIFMAVLVFCVPFKIVINQFITKLRIQSDVLLPDIVKARLTSKQISIYLLLCIILGLAVPLIPHISIINPNNEPLGVDSLRYVESLKIIENQTGNPIHFILKSPGERPLTLMILFLIIEVTAMDPFQVVEYSPLILTPLLVMVTFFITRQLTANDRISILAAFLSTISFQTIVGLYSGFYANWIALTFGYLALGLLVKYLRSPSKICLITLAIAITAVQFAHIYTWSIIMFIAFVYLFVLHIFHYYPRRHFLILYLILASSIAVDIIKSSLTGSPTGLETDVSVASNLGFGFSQFTERFRTLSETVQTYYGGAFANISILGLALYWLIRCRVREISSIFMLIFLSSALVPLFLGDWVFQSRVLYNIPFQIPAAISLYTVWKQNHKILFVALILIAIYLSFHILANLGFVPPANPSRIIQ